MYVPSLYQYDLKGTKLDEIMEHVEHYMAKGH
jgi:protein involved in ribonucleotide reduction